jgi:hypothetical protein
MHRDLRRYGGKKLSDTNKIVKIIIILVLYATESFKCVRTLGGTLV